MREIRIEEMRKIQLSILEKIDAYCKKYGVTYYLYHGSLLGAVRHQGVIPWDDDIDIGMKRDDYERFFSGFNEESHDCVRAINQDNYKGYYLASGKVIDERTVMIEETKYNLPIGVYIDVFPLDYLPGDIKKVRTLNRRINIYRKILLLKSVKNNSKRSMLKNAVLFLGGILCKPIPVSWVLSRIKTLSTTYNDEENPEIISVISVLNYGMRELLKADDFRETTQLLFEGKYYPAPVGYDSVLSALYGDYMTLPPEEKKVSHHAYKAYWKENDQ